MSERQKAAFDLRITSERKLIKNFLEKDFDLPTIVERLGEPTYDNPLSEDEVGNYRPHDSFKVITADLEVIETFIKANKKIPSFREAGPRSKFYFNPQSVRAGIVTTGGLAPGIHYVIHSIVKRHWDTYKINKSAEGDIFGIYESFDGLTSKPMFYKTLDPDITEEWLDRGGCMLGMRRGTYHKDNDVDKYVNEILANLNRNHLNILYIIGGNGSLSLAHKIAKATSNISIVGIPKTMDNDLLWVWNSFGFNTAVEKATEVVNTMHSEAQSTRRICIIELFGAESGFVAANAALASGHVDLVLIPEPFKELSKEECEKSLLKLLNHLLKIVSEKDTPHGIVVLAEGLGELFRQKEVMFEDILVTGKGFIDQLKNFLQKRAYDRAERKLDVFINQPRHNIRAINANSYDQIYCERLGALAVDNALAGYTDFMISQWLTEYVLVPLELVSLGQKSIPPGGIFWKQVINSTRQPNIGSKN